MGIWPINPRLDAPASATLIWVKNNSTTDAIVLQARIFSWSQKDNSDSYDAQDELVVSPPMIEVKPGAQQMFRIVNRAGAIQDMPREKSFRVLLDEIPNINAKNGPVLNFQMRYSLPLFVGKSPLQSKSSSAQLKSIEQGLSYKIVGDANPAIEINNNNPWHVRLSSVKVANADSAAEQFQLSEGLLGYVLPSSVKRWPITREQLAALRKKNAMVIFQQEQQELTIAGEK
ncbi:MAG TPA: fimbria/pilus periplasmic chaperone [Cellvibrio sp.]|nr:fimbria/pilus periplasmic chaperone [Cellvibrio sp.]